jgi:hypothetical protein
MISRLLGSVSNLAHLGSVALVFLALWQIWDVFSPKQPELPYLRKQVADQTIGRIVSDLPRVATIKTVVVLPFANDPTGYVTSQIHDRLQASGRFQVIDDTLWQKIQKEVGIEGKPVSTLPDALDVGRKTGTDAAIFGEVRTFEMTETVGTIDLFVRMVDLRNELVLYAMRYQDSMTASPLSISYVASRISDSSLPRRVVIGFLFILLLPWLTIQAMVIVLKRQSNGANAGLILVYTLADALVIYVLMGFNLDDWLSTLTILISIGLAALYSIVVANYVAGLET